MKQKLTAARLREVLTYFPETGEFVWKVSLSSRYAAGRRAGCLLPTGYRAIGIDGAMYYSHRLAWLYVHGVWPSALLDHKNGVKNDNRIRNLRECSAVENSRNRGGNMRRLGFKGVTLDKKFRPMVRENLRRQQDDPSRQLRVHDRSGRGLRRGGAPLPWCLCEDQWDVPVAMRAKFSRVTEAPAEEAHFATIKWTRSRPREKKPKTGHTQRTNTCSLARLHRGEPQGRAGLRWPSRLMSAHRGEADMARSSRLVCF